MEDYAPRSYDIDAAYIPVGDQPDVAPVAPPKESIVSRVWSVARPIVCCLCCPFICILRYVVISVLVTMVVLAALGLGLYFALQ